MKRFVIFLAGLILVFNTSCSALLKKSSEDQQTPVFRPPAPPTQAVAVQVESTEQLPDLENASRPDANCKDNLTFLNDLTIDDGTTVTAQATMDKRWEVENSGTCNWNASYRVRLIAGPDMGAQKEQSLYPARSGSRATIRILFQAPTEPGDYRSAWQAYNGKGEAFGDPFFIDIIVNAAP